MAQWRHAQTGERREGEDLHYPWIDETVIAARMAARPDATEREAAARAAARGVIAARLEAAREPAPKAKPRPRKPKSGGSTDANS